MVALGNILAVIGFLWFWAGLAAIWQPRFIRLAKRRHAAAFWGFSLVVFGLGMDLAPADAKAEPMFGPMLAIWVIGVAIGFGVARIAKVRRETAQQQSVSTISGEHAALARMGERGRAASSLTPARSAPTAPPEPASRAPQRASRRRAPEQQWEVDDYGEEASFTYVDADGVITDRTIVNWRSEGAYIRGICVQRQQSRTFRKDRIEDWSAI